MYHPIWKNKFKDVIDLTDGKLQVDTSPAARKLLAASVNDNVYKNIDKFSVMLFDESSRYSKQELSQKEKTAMVDALVQESAIKEQVDDLHKAVDRVLITHRNSKLFLVLMSGPFCMLLMGLKYSCKLALLYLFYKKTKPSREAHQNRTTTSAPCSPIARTAST